MTVRDRIDVRGPAALAKSMVGSQAKRDSSDPEFFPRRGGGGFAIDCKIACRPKGGETARLSDAESHSSRTSRRKTQEGGGLNPLNLNSAARLGAGSISASDLPESAAPDRINSNTGPWLREAMAWRRSRPRRPDDSASAAAICMPSGLVQAGSSSGDFGGSRTGEVGDVRPR